MHSFNSAKVFGNRRAYEAGQRAASFGAGLLGRLTGRTDVATRLPGPLSAWTGTRDAPLPPPESFRQWWAREKSHGGTT